MCHLTQCPNNVKIRNYMLNNCANQVKRCSYMHQRRVSGFFSVDESCSLERQNGWNRMISKLSTFKSLSRSLLISQNSLNTVPHISRSPRHNRSPTWASMEQHATYVFAWYLICCVPYLFKRCSSLLSAIPFALNKDKRHV